MCTGAYNEARGNLQWWYWLLMSEDRVRGVSAQAVLGDDCHKGKLASNGTDCMSLSKSMGVLDQFEGL